MLGSAKTNLPLLTLTSWVKGTSPFETCPNLGGGRKRLSCNRFHGCYPFPPLWILNWSDLLTAQSWSVDFSAQAGVVLFVPTNNFTHKHHHRFGSKKLGQLHYSSAWAYLRIFNLLSYPTPSQNWPPVVVCTSNPNSWHQKEVFLTVMIGWFLF